MKNYKKYLNNSKYPELVLEQIEVNRENLKKNKKNKKKAYTSIEIIEIRDNRRKEKAIIRKSICDYNNKSL